MTLNYVFKRYRKNQKKIEGAVASDSWAGIIQNHPQHSILFITHYYRKSECGKRKEIATFTLSQINVMWIQTLFRMCYAVVRTIACF